MSKGGFFVHVLLSSLKDQRDTRRFGETTKQSRLNFNLKFKDKRCFYETQMTNSNFHFPGNFALGTFKTPLKPNSEAKHSSNVFSPANLRPPFT
jgi:hypothetical protein